MEIIIAIASKIGECLVTPIGTEFGYLVNYHSNLESLRGEIRKLFDKKDGVQGLVDAAKRNGEIIKPDVQSWLKNANDDMVKKVLQFEDEINKKRRCVYRWSLSRRAYKIKQEVLQLQNEGRFENVAHPTPPPEIWSTFEKGFKDFKSRKENMNEVIEGLKREEVRMIGICGMGGVGKTTMVKEIITRLAKLNLFDKIVMATVSQSPSIRTIQSEIADKIGLKFEEESESGRALKLHRILKDKKRILIVLDDVWTEPDFEAIGLPYGDTHKGCKILLTSRDSDICNRMGSQQIIAVPTLTTEESWELFREMVGESFDDPDLRSIAKEVVNECGGLPIAIVTVGKALEKKKKHEWVDALNQLRNSIPANIPGLNNKVYTSIKWSYDRLESDEAKSCLLLCCLFPEDYDIPIEYLVRYGWGRGYFSSCVTLEDARNRVHSLVDKLKRRFLLLDSEVSEATKMHDIVRDVAISIASRDPHRFLIRNHAKNNGWPSLATYDHYSTISLVGNLKIPVDLKCPKVELLQMMKGRFLEGSMDIICNAMEELKVLALVKMEDLGSSRSLEVKKNLRTLCLDYSNVDGLSTVVVIEGLENLEILSFRDSYRFFQLPREIGRLKQLRLLDTTNCRNLVIPHGILSSLCRLEELYMVNSFRDWELATGREDKRVASISEVMSLSDHLKVLAIDIPCVNHLFPKDIVLKSLTIRFHIRTGILRRYRFESCAFENKLVIDQESDARELMESQAIRLFLKKSEDLYLCNVKNFTVLTDLDQEGFQHLKVLRLSECLNTEYLANGTSGTQLTLFPRIQSISLTWMRELKAICPNDKLPESCFTNLRSLNLHLCDLKYVFPLSVARNLAQLQNLVIQQCKKMEEVVLKQGREHEEAADMVAFPKLTNLTLDRLWSCVGFFQDINLYSNQEVTTPNVEHQSAGILETAIFSSKCISWLQSLEEVKLDGLRPDVLFDLKRHIVMDGQAVPLFSHLRKLEISRCSFTHLWKNIMSGFQGFQNLRDLKINKCSGLEYVFLQLFVRELLNLAFVRITSCPNMETIVRNTEEKEEEAIKDTILFPKLKKFDLEDLPRLTSICPEGFTFLWSSTKSMNVKNCEKLKTLGAVIPRRKKLEHNIEKDSTSHDFSASPTRSSNWCPAGCGCTPYSRGNAHRCIEILPRSVNLEVTPTNLEDSNDNDNLEGLRVIDCASFEVIFQLKGPKHEEMSHSVEAFNKLRTVWLKNLPSLTRIWETGSSQPMFSGRSFGNLILLVVEWCNQLKDLFSSSMVKLLVSIEVIKVINCEQIEEIVAAKEEATKGMILFPKLKTFELNRLPRLTSLCPEGFTFLWSSTKNMRVEKCESLKTLGVVIPERKKLENNFGKDSTSHEISTSPNRSSNHSIELLPRPINLEGSNETDNLENLLVSDCASLEAIFQLNGPKHEESSHSVEAFNKLRSLRLYKLPSLTRVWETGSSQPMLTGSSFGNLKSLQVDCCNQLKYLFSSSIAKLLVSIEDIEVMDCEQMEEMVAAEEETAEIITLPKVKSIKLMRLPKLKFFCGEAYTLKLPSLVLLKVVNVQNLRLFTPNPIDTHPLLQVHTASGVAEWMGDLNATLRNIYDTREG